jgi:hypothetical protein
VVFIKNGTRDDLLNAMKLASRDSSHIEWEKLALDGSLEVEMEEKKARI